MLMSLISIILLQLREEIKTSVIPKQKHSLSFRHHSKWNLLFLLEHLVNLQVLFIHYLKGVL